jgi:hypothetical protein
MIAQAGSEEIMRLKHELAIQRAMKNAEPHNGYKPSINALI